MITKILNMARKKNAKSKVAETSTETVEVDENIKNEEINESEIDENDQTVWDYDYPSGMSMIPRAQKYGYDYFDSVSLLGDLNEDGLINILDIIITVNIILGTEDYDQNADINEDGIINILDVVSILNIILGN